jgi:hypothetical protein
VVVWKHALKNATIPVLTFSVMLFVIRVLPGRVVERSHQLQDLVERHGRLRPPFYGLRMRLDQCVREGDAGHHYGARRRSARWIRLLISSAFFNSALIVGHV